MRPTIREIYRARKRLIGVTRRTPLERSAWLSGLARCDVYLKLECWQRTHSFKMRGAYNAVASLDPEARAHGLVAASAGNHGQALALAARLVGARAIIYVPDSAPEVKQERIRAYGAELRPVEGIYDDAMRAARTFAAESGAHLVHPFADPDVVAGQGTVALEILQDLPDVREVVVPVGGGGLITGIAVALQAALGDDASVLGVQTVETSSMHASFNAGHAVLVEPGETLADGLAGGIEETSYQRVHEVVEHLELVDEDTVADAVRMLYRHDGIVAEGAAAVPAAALIERKLELRGPTVLVVSGGNIDAPRLARVLAAD